MNVTIYGIFRGCSDAKVNSKDSFTSHVGMCNKVFYFQVSQRKNTEAMTLCSVTLLRRGRRRVLFAFVDGYGIIRFSYGLFPLLDERDYFLIYVYTMGVRNLKVRERRGYTRLMMDNFRGQEEVFTVSLLFVLYRHQRGVGENVISAVLLTTKGVSRYLLL